MRVRRITLSTLPCYKVGALTDCLSANPLKKVVSDEESFHGRRNYRAVTATGAIATGTVTSIETATELAAAALTKNTTLVTRETTRDGVKEERHASQPGTGL